MRAQENALFHESFRIDADAKCIHLDLFCRMACMEMLLPPSNGTQRRLSIMPFDPLPASYTYAVITFWSLLAVEVTQTFTFALNM